MAFTSKGPKRDPNASGGDDDPHSADRAPTTRGGGDDFHANRSTPPTEIPKAGDAILNLCDKDQPEAPAPEFQFLGLNLKTQVHF